ncbi:MAG: hypothetical protein K8T25_05740 [Planctomycetia bacterium]|nr:hypothetical protein [Planctomycetia bacterium]
MTGACDPELLVTGEGNYYSERVATPWADDREFRIIPRPLPVLGIFLMNLMFVGFFFGIHWAVKQGGGDNFGVYYVPIGVGLLTCAGYTTVMIWGCRNENRQGPWLIYNKAMKKLRLPRNAVEFDISEIVHLQYLTTPPRNRSWDPETLSELVLVTNKDGKLTRWVLIASGLNFRAFEYLLRPLVQHTPLPVVRIVGDRKQVNITPFVP